MVMLAEYGRLSLAEVLQPAIELADGYPIEAELANRIERDKRVLKQWPETVRVLLPHAGEPREAPRAGEIFRQSDLAATLRRLVEAERRALQRGASRKAAIQAAYDLFYKGELGAEFGMTPQQASEAANMNSFQLHDSFGEHPISPGRMMTCAPWASIRGQLVVLRMAMANFLPGRLC